MGRCARKKWKAMRNRPLLPQVARRGEGEEEERRVGREVEERRGGVAHLVPQWEEVVKEERAWIRVLRVPTS